MRQIKKRFEATNKKGFSFLKKRTPDTSQDLRYLPFPAFTGFLK